MTHRDAAASPGASISALLALFGGALLLISFFVPTFQGAYWLDDEVARTLGHEPTAARSAESTEATRALVEVGGLGPRIAARAAGDDVALNEAVVAHRLTPFEFMRFWQLADYQGEALALGRDERAAARLAWNALALIALAGLVAVAYAVGRGLRALSPGQIAWNGLFGTVCLLGAIGMSFAGETRQVASTMVGMFDAVGVFVLGCGAAILLLSAFAGLSRDNWYKVPVAALGWLVLLAVVAGAPLYALVT